MRLSASDFILFCNDPVQNAQALSKIVPEVELMLDGDAWENSADLWQHNVEALKNSGISFSVHPPAWNANPASPMPELRCAVQELNRKAALFAHEVGAGQVVFHPGHYDGHCFFSKTKAIDRCYESLDKLIQTAKPLGLTIAFENIAPPASALFTQEEFAHALDGIDGCVKYLLDVGHANMNAWDIPAVIEKLAPRLCAFHLHDNDGSADSHLSIGSGNICWDKCFSVMRQLPDDVLYVLEYAPGIPLSELQKGAELLRENLE